MTATEMVEESDVTAPVNLLRAFATTKDASCPRIADHYRIVGSDGGRCVCCGASSSSAVTTPSSASGSGDSLWKGGSTSHPAP